MTMSGRSVATTPCPVVRGLQHGRRDNFICMNEHIFAAKSLAAHFVPIMTDSASSLPELATGFSYRIGDANDLSEA